MKKITVVTCLLAPMIVACGNRAEVESKFANNSANGAALVNYAGGPLDDGSYDSQYAPGVCTYQDYMYGWVDDNGYPCTPPQVSMPAAPANSNPDLKSPIVLDFNSVFNKVKVPSDERQPIVLSTGISELRLHNGVWERSCANLGKAMVTAPSDSHRVFASHRTPFMVVPDGNAPTRYSTRDLTVCQFMSSSYREPAYFTEARTLASDSVTLRLSNVSLFSIEKINSRIVIVDQPDGLATQRRIFIAAKSGSLSSRVKDCLNSVNTLVANTHKANGVEIKIDFKGADLARDASGSYLISTSGADHMRCSTY